MKLNGILITVFWNILYVENRMIPAYQTIPTVDLEVTEPALDQNDGNPHEKVLGLKSEDSEEYGYDMDKKMKPCAIVVLSNYQNPNMQSLTRKYRYDSNGVLIPSSVQYFIKLPQGRRSSPLLVPLNNKAFSPLGGFVRYYKEVPPIPQTWKR